MKKTILSVAIAVVATALVTSCGNKSAENAEAKDSANVEQQAPQEEVEVKIEDQKELTCDDYTIKVPEGWKARSRMVNSSCTMGFKEPPFTSASPNYSSYTTIEKFKEMREKEGAKQIDNLEVNGNTFEVFYREMPNGQQCVSAVTPKGDGSMYVNFQTGAHKLDQAAAKDMLMAHVKTILENLTIK